MRKVAEAAEELVAQEYLLEEDLDRVAEDAGRQYDLIMERAREPQAADN